jgi:hypothetical protein
MTVKRYLLDPTTSGTVKITQIVSADRPIIRLAETWFHPHGSSASACQVSSPSNRRRSVAFGGAISCRRRSWGGGCNPIDRTENGREIWFD